jgi:hypothetical protein
MRRRADEALMVASYDVARAMRRPRHPKPHLLPLAWACILFALVSALFALEVLAVSSGLSRAAALWQPTRISDGAFVADVVERSCQGRSLPRCAPLVLALSFRESSWRHEALGRRGEVGLMQLHGAALSGVARERAMEPRTNVALGVAWLEVAAERCRRAGWGGSEERLLSAYAGLGCARSRGARLVVKWADEIEDFLASPES